MHLKKGSADGELIGIEFNKTILFILISMKNDLFHIFTFHFMKTKKKDKKEKQQSKDIEKSHVQLHRSLNVKMKDGNAKGSILTQLQDKMKGSKFRWINEQLYTQSGDKSLAMIQNDTSLFDVYHQGFREQVRRWPLVPVDVFIKMLK